MSVEINTTEAIRIKVTDEGTKELLNRIIRQFRSLNEGARIEFGATVQYIKLTVNGETATADNQSGMPLFSDDTEIMALLNANDIRELELQLDYTAMVLSGGCYGYSFLNSLCDEFDKETLGALEYKLLEYYDCDESIVACLLKDGELIHIEPDTTQADVSDVKEWFSYNFQLIINADDEFNDDIINKLTEMGEAFADKYLDGEYEEPDECEMVLGAAVELSTDKLEQFRADVESFVVFANANGLDVELVAPFTPDSCCQKYAYATVEIGDAGTEIHYAKF